MADQLAMFDAPRVESGATLSPCGTWRFQLWRRWDDRPPAAFIMLNPSTADASADDPTIRRCIGFARRWDCGGIVVANLFAFRATDPDALASAADPIGPHNDAFIVEAARRGEVVVCAWGAHAEARGRDRAVANVLAGRDLRCLGTTKDGHPRHPLYVRGDAVLEPFEVRRG